MEKELRLSKVTSVEESKFGDRSLAPLNTLLSEFYLAARNEKVQFLLLKSPILHDFLRAAPAN